MNISQETKDFILNIANRQIQKILHTHANLVMKAILDSTLDNAKIELPIEFVGLPYDFGLKLIASVLAESHTNGNLIADKTVTKTTTIYHKKLD